MGCANCRCGSSQLREQSSALEEKLAGVTQHAAVNLQKVSVYHWMSQFLSLFFIIKIVACFQWKDAVSELEKRPSMNSVVKDAATIKTLQWQLASLVRACCSHRTSTPYVLILLWV